MRKNKKMSTQMIINPQKDVNAELKMNASLPKRVYHAVRWRKAMEGSDTSVTGDILRKICRGHFHTWKKQVSSIYTLRFKFFIYFFDEKENLLP